MSLKKLFVYAFTIFIVSLPSNSEAGKTDSKSYNWDPVLERDWAVKEDTSRGMRDAVILFENIEADEKDWDQSKVYYTVYRRIRILSDEGRSWGDVTIPWHSKKQKIRMIVARVILRDGTINLLDPKSVVEKEILKTKGLKIKQKSFSLKGVTNDCIVEYAYKLRLPSSIRLWRIQRDAYLISGQLRWKFFRASSSEYTDAKSYAPNYLWLHTNEFVDVKRLPSLKDTKELVFSVNNVKPLKDQPYSLPDVARQGQLRYYYGESGAAAAYWGDVATDLIEAFDEFCSKDKKLKDAVESVYDSLTEADAVKAAYKWVQAEFRNTTFADEEEKFKKIKRVDDVFKRGYGSRRQLNYLFCDLLREMDIDARIAYVVDRDENLLVYDAKYWQFDRSLIAVPNSDGESYSFYAPGDVYRPPGEVAWYNQGISAIISGDTRKTFYSVGWNAPSTNSVSRLLTLSLNEDLTVSGTGVERLKGDPAYRIRYYLNESVASRMQEELDEHFEDVFPNAKVDSINLSNKKDLSEALVVNHRIEYETPLQKVGSRLMIKPLQFLSSTSNSFDEKDRDARIVFAYAFKTNETASIEIPPEWDIEALPSDTTFSNSVGSCTVTFKELGSTLSAQREFTLNSPFWEAENYAEVQALYESREAISNLTVVLKQNKKKAEAPADENNQETE